MPSTQVITRPTEITARSRFRNAVVIMTSNAPREALKSIFRPEFLNRLDEILEFQSLTEEQIKAIVKLQLKDFSRRRTFAIISHPDAGKTTLTEKFLLYGGAIAQAGETPNITFIANKWDAIWISLVESVCRVCVPLFVMASSYLLFPLKKSTGEFFRRRLSRIVIPFVVWACAYIWWFGDSWGKACFNFPDAGGHLWCISPVSCR